MQGLLLKHGPHAFTPKLLYDFLTKKALEITAP